MHATNQIPDAGSEPFAQIKHDTEQMTLHAFSHAVHGTSSLQQVHARLMMAHAILPSDKSPGQSKSVQAAECLMEPAAAQERCQERLMVPDLGFSQAVRLRWRPGNHLLKSSGSGS